MKIQIVGTGGREDVLQQTFQRQGHTVVCHSETLGAHALAAHAKEEGVDLTVVGPEGPLAQGIVDIFQKAGLKIFGPKKSAMFLESSKVLAKEFMARHNIPTARFVVCHTSEQARDIVDIYFDRWGGLVVKPDGLTAGKGVVPCKSKDDAYRAITQIMDEEIYGPAGQTVIIEELLEGKEVSLLVFSDGITMTPMIPSQDHKRLCDGGEGPNTGGMGAYAPVPFFTEANIEAVRRTQEGLRAERIDYCGVLYFGLMITIDGVKVLEYNCRFGDPETQVVVPLIKSDLAEVMLACIDKRLGSTTIEWSNRHACCVVMASDGYPFDYGTGYPILGLESFVGHEDLYCFQAGTTEVDGQVMTAGGRVVGITGLGDTLDQAIEKAYEGVSKVSFEGAVYRKDIGRREIDIQRKCLAKKC